MIEKDFKLQKEAKELSCEGDETDVYQNKLFYIPWQSALEIMNKVPTYLGDFTIELKLTGLSNKL